MSTEVATQNGNTQMAIPASLAVLFGGKSNLVKVDNTPTLTFKGKVFTVNLKGEHKQLLDEDENPLPTVEVIVLGANPYRSRVFYEGQYTEGSTASPTCSSYDGRHPAKEVTEPQSNSCESCPQSVKGSKMTESGVATTACSLRQRNVVVPSDKVDFPALALNLASTSAYDKEEPDSAKGWFSWSGYVKSLVARGITNTAMVKTRIRFSPNEAYPKLQFRFNGFIDESVAATVVARTESDEVLSLLNRDYKETREEPKAIAAPKPAQVAEEPKETPVAQEQPKAAPKAAKTKPAPVAQEPVQEAPAKPKATPVVVEDKDLDLASVLSSWE